MLRRALFVTVAVPAALVLCSGTAGAAPSPVTVTTSTQDGVAVQVVVDERKTGVSGGAAASVGSSDGLACVGFSYQVPQCVGDGS